ncbi:histidine kinase-, DNA gyrase B-, and HSP90-like ATPase family protein [Acinetobacter baumannii 25493_8]|uniref:sensor histidine kinase n=2 Tax=Acinetobacter baumannii TaxID=470 RepID=UPI0002BC4ED0|nr:HAMP domain-containing sensor histidine kinase [Acinetobacter baumannii]EYD51489.1 histidine kinase-, DNA gyrase B-, and HSP90-like ATPase family protein [Acinetobacter baumannii 25493_4]EYS14363.1 histidine kinase-, DNA gyrase B-, and HSP90-like ATPase family protein [Acinetobacter baumannii 25569_7]EHU2134088.1 HAMP domain-containing histidine kinase [Acinetobacter baumannii]EIG0124859.1 HAMP domain-containing histidine kinase [Acinetobacter baumannii]EXA80874.1 histidine kinase-, DNA gyr
MELNEFLNILDKASPEKQIQLINDFRENHSEIEFELFVEKSKNRLWYHNVIGFLIYQDKKTNITLVENCDSLEIYNDNLENIEDVKSRAIAENLSFVIHELQPIIGSIDLFASQEIENYEASKVAGEIDCLRGLVEMFSAWRKAENPLVYKSININALVREEITRLTPIYNDEIINNIKEDLIFDVDISLLRVIISNGLRNACESTLLVKDRSPQKICINGGTTDKFLWISIIDDGLGLADEQPNLLKVNNSTKSKGRGFGLAIISKSLDAMKGSLNLENSKPNGACFYFQIPRIDKL